MKRPLLLLCLVGGLAAGLAAAGGCGGAATASADVLRGLPPRHDPPLDLTDDDDLGRARGLYEALPLDAPGRLDRRQELVSAYLAKVGKGQPPDEVFRRFQQVIGLWDARELADVQAVPPDLALVAAEAETRFKEASTTGLDVQAITALTVLVAAHPERRAAYDRTWKDILAFTNDLAIAEAGPGAERSRAIEALEVATASFPSRWAGERLVELYLARQASITKAIAGGTKADVLGAHKDPGVVRPVWNLVRAYARMRHLADAPATVDTLSGQFGDEPELRKRLHAALGDQATGADVIALMAAYLPSRDGDSGDGGVALAICEDGAARLPAAVEPRKCAAEIARVTDRAPLAVRWGEDARRVAPDDHDVGEILARLYIVRMADLLAAERVDAARARMQELEAFYADAATRWAKKPLDVTLADAFLAYGRGLYNLGEVKDGVAALERAQTLAPSPAVTEELATVALKTGRYADAEKGFVAAAEQPRATPIDTAFDGNRLRRLAGEAAALAGEAGRAGALLKRTLTEWNEVLTASLTPRAKAQALTELGRVFDDLGQTDKALQAMAAALDTDPEQPGVYGDVIAFLATRGHYDEARDAYHRALGRQEVTEYLKVYTSLWIVDLGRMTRRDPDALATEYLGQIAKSGKWYNQLAKFKLGQLDYDGLLARADTRGKRAEAYFYEATARYARGDRPGAERLLADVVATQMLGFFEYEMARWYLKNGAPRTGEKPTGRQ